MPEPGSNPAVWLQALAGKLCPVLPSKHTGPEGTPVLVPVNDGGALYTGQASLPQLVVEVTPGGCRAGQAQGILGGVPKVGESGVSLKNSEEAIALERQRLGGGLWLSEWSLQYSATNNEHFPLSPGNSPMKSRHCHHRCFTDGETAAHRGHVTCPRSHSSHVTELGRNLSPLAQGLDSHPRHHPAAAVGLSPVATIVAC